MPYRYKYQMKYISMDQLELKFMKATKRVQELNLTSEDELELYGLFRQANEGDCQIPRPGWFQSTKKAKWEAWNAVMGMTKSQSMLKYISIVDRVDPDWENELEVEPKVRKDGSSHQSAEHSVSTFSGQEPAGDLKNIFDWCKEGNLEKVDSLLNSININQFDFERMGLLHWACDRDDLDMVKLLVEKGADVNVQDREKQTPLHYAVSHNYVQVASHLLESGARRDIKDLNGQLPQELSDDPSIKQLFWHQA